jgi:hypothetical protein
MIGNSTSNTALFPFGQAKKMATKLAAIFKYMPEQIQGEVGVSSLPSAAMMIPPMTAAAARIAIMIPDPPSTSFSPSTVALVRATEETGCAACARTGALTSDAAAAAAIPILPKRIFSSFRVFAFHSIQVSK